MISRLRQCAEAMGDQEMLEICRIQTTQKEEAASAQPASDLMTGYVYLMKSGRHYNYKIGRTISVGSRERQLAIKIPISPTTIHSIETDDPMGVEAYWHRRFESKRGEGEWFMLSNEDVKAFKRWKKIV